MALHLANVDDLPCLQPLVAAFHVHEGITQTSKQHGRGMGGEALRNLMPVLADHGVKALHLEVDRDNETAKRLYKRQGFMAREKYHLMTWAV